ncbi:transposase [Micromonospora purpureochromogenes]|uniref:transposase n=1 Tax=Micromonospora purpureochromogenes TaxID=47872 RepID=UPI0038B24544
MNERRVFCGILFVLHNAIPWEYLPQELRFGCGMTCWRRFPDWNDAGRRNDCTGALSRPGSRLTVQYQDPRDTVVG